VSAHYGDFRHQTDERVYDWMRHFRQVEVQAVNAATGHRGNLDDVGLAGAHVL